MEEKLKFVYGQPEGGTPTFGVVYHVDQEKDIKELTGYDPLGYVIEKEEEE